MHFKPQRKFSELPIWRTSLLTTAEQFVLGTCRCWDAFMDSPDNALAWRELGPIFAYMNVLGAMCAFELAFKTMRVHRKRPLCFHEGDDPQLGIDEARILCALASLQRAEVRPVIRLLTDPLTPLGVRAVLPPLARIAAVLDAQGHRLPQWQSNAQQRDAAPERERPSLRPKLKAYSVA